jgi:hypothetical protein
MAPELTGTASQLLSQCPTAVRCHLQKALQNPSGEAFAAFLNAGTRPFDAINYRGARGAALFYNKRRVARKLETTIKAITRRLERGPRRHSHERMRAWLLLGGLACEWERCLIDLIQPNLLPGKAYFGLTQGTTLSGVARGNKLGREQRIGSWPRQ